MTYITGADEGWNDADVDCRVEHPAEQTEDDRETKVVRVAPLLAVVTSSLHIHIYIVLISAINRTVILDNLLVSLCSAYNHKKCMTLYIIVHACLIVIIYMHTYQ